MQLSRDCTSFFIFFFLSTLKKAHKAESVCFPFTCSFKRQKKGELSGASRQLYHSNNTTYRCQPILILQGESSRRKL